MISTDKVVLRPWCASDAGALGVIYGDPLSVQYVEVPQPYDLARATEFVRRAARSRAAGTAFHYAVTLPGAGTVVGSAYLHDFAPTGVATDVSYLIHPDHRGRGFATAALVALTEAALTAGFQQVRARIEPGNRISEAVAAGAGFRLDGANTEEVCWRKTAKDAAT